MKKEDRPVGRLTYVELNILLEACDWLMDGPENARAMEALHHRDRVTCLNRTRLKLMAVYARLRPRQRDRDVELRLAYKGPR